MAEELDAMKQRAALAQAYEAVFAGPDGERVLEDIAREGLVNAVKHVEGDGYTTAFNCGKEALALHVINQLHLSHNPALRLLMRRRETAPPREAEQEESEE